MEDFYSYFKRLMNWKNIEYWMSNNEY